MNTDRLMQLKVIFTNLGRNSPLDEKRTCNLHASSVVRSIIIRKEDPVDYPPQAQRSHIDCFFLEILKVAHKVVLPIRYQVH